MANKKRWSEIRDINRNEALTWSSDRLREELREQKRRYEGFNKWFNSPASEYAKGGKWGYYNQSIRGQKIWDDIQYLECLLNSPEKEPSTTSYKSSTLSPLRADTKELKSLPKWVISLLSLSVSGMVVGGIGIKKYNEYKNKKPQLKTSISGTYDRTQDYKAVNQPTRISAGRQTKTQSLEEKVKTNLIKWRRENGRSTHLVSIYDCEIVGKYAWVACYLGRGKGGILHSSNEGDTWEFQGKKDFFGLSFLYLPFEIEFLNEREGWAATSKSILHTINGGKNWAPTSRPYTKSSFGGGYIRKFQIIGNKHLRVYLSDGKPYDSFNRGYTWEQAKD